LDNHTAITGGDWLIVLGKWVAQADNMQSEIIMPCQKFANPGAFLPVAQVYHMQFKKMMPCQNYAKPGALLRVMDQN
jgi:hypothetical protein